MTDRYGYCPDCEQQENLDEKGRLARHKVYNGRGEWYWCGGAGRRPMLWPGAPPDAGEEGS